MAENKLDLIKKEVTSFISDLGIEANLEITEKEEEGEQILEIKIESTQNASLIGFHGETMHSLQTIISFICHKILEKWVKVVLDIGDYRQKREDQLKNLALSLAQKAKFSGETQVVPNLSAYERRFIHMFLAESPDVVSQSEGEGRNRVLMIKNRSK